MNLSSLPQAHVQIIYLSISPEHDLKDTTSKSGQLWHSALNAIEQSEGYQRLHWGRSVEYPDNIQLHIVRSSLSAHQPPDTLLQRLQPLLKGGTKPVTRHVSPMTTFTSTPTTAFNAPVTGSAIYIRTTPAWHEGSWPCWTHIVRHIDGNSGIAAGPLVEVLTENDVRDGSAGGGMKSDRDAGDLGQCYLVYVGWESIKAHEDYHHTKHFADHRVVLGIGNGGFREYGHIKFEGGRWKKEGGDSVGGTSKL